jgi:hypothetical protein
MTSSHHPIHAQHTDFVFPIPSRTSALAFPVLLSLPVAPDPSAYHARRYPPRCMLCVNSVPERLTMHDVVLVPCVVDLWSRGLESFLAWNVV